MSIAPIAPPTTIAPIEGTGALEKAPAPGGDFGKAFADAKNLETDATKAAEAFAKGDTGAGIHEVMIASEKANVALRFATTLKNKAIEAYRELMNTQV